ncbi:MAG: hypothetical protein AAGA48_33510 [Myxococcota bacterium]
MNGLTLLENLKAATAGGPAGSDPLTGLDSRASFLASLRSMTGPRALATVSLDPVRRGQPRRTGSVVRKMTARTGALMACELAAADALGCWDTDLLVATFAADRLAEAEESLEGMRARFAEMSFAATRGPPHFGTLTAAIAEWSDPTDTAFAAALLRARAGLAAAQLRGGDCIITVDTLFGPFLPSLFVA